ncbi:Predicted chitinase [Ewingella americana]|uniref:Predicted chitinase n=1 Tax=Ewingella americana TaxID=41202 RepID=A0A377NE85_9GAMM|nr:Predicted chitinase [Ewingella americana]
MVPATAPLWMTVNYPGGQGVVNLAVAAVKKFSDADFPHWAGWQLVNDDKDTHSQCNSAAIRKLREENRYAAQSRKLICCMPFEWEKSTIDARYKWLMTGLPWEQCTPEKTAIWRIPVTNESKDRVLMNEKDYDRFKQHAEALCFDSGALGSGKVWHFDPRGFIEHFRKCGWLDCKIIKEVMAANTNKKNKNALTTIQDITLQYYVDINKLMNKYNLSGANRICHFLGQGAVESGYLLSMQEASQQQNVVNGVQKGGNIVEISTYNETTELGHWYGLLDTEKDKYFYEKKYNSRGGYITGSYSWINGNCGDVDAQKFRGRGFKMLTGLDTYASYWVYRGWLSVKDFDKYWWDDPAYKNKKSAAMKKRPPKIDSPQRVTENTYNCIDTGAFFIACFKSKVLKIMDEDSSEVSDDNNIIERVTKRINGGDKGIAERKIATKKAKEVIDDQI